MATDKPITKQGEREGEEPASTKLARQTRETANRLSDSDRARLFERGMQIIYGAAPAKQAVRARH